MLCCWVIKCGGFVGCHRFDNEADAVDTVENVTILSGQRWVAERILYIERRAERCS